jgi:hypothetical protein
VASWEKRCKEVEADAIKKGEHAAEVEDEAGNLTAQIEAFAVVNSRLQDAATSAQCRADAEAGRSLRTNTRPTFNPRRNVFGPFGRPGESKFSYDGLGVGWPP